jgi:hypothetical protein
MRFHWSRAMHDRLEDRRTAYVLVFKMWKILKNSTEFITIESIHALNL